MSQNNHLQLQQRQEQKLHAQQIQSVAVLQMNTQQLLAHIEEVATENPVLEREVDTRAQAEMRSLLQSAGGENSEPYYGGRVDPAIDGFSAFLTDQLSRRRLSADLLRCCIGLVALLDNDGYLMQEDIDSLQDLFSAEMLHDALTTLQSLEPAGVGARNLSECLSLQLRRSAKDDPLSLLLVQSYLPRLAKQQYRLIARELRIPEAAVIRAAKTIAALEPHPGREFAPVEQVAYIRPDLFILPVDGKLQVILNDGDVPRLSVSDYYAKLLRTTDDEEAKTYLRQKKQQATWLIQGVERRGNTLRRCGELILERQRDFFSGHTKELSPMSGLELSQALRLHPSTVSRALQGKYLQCPQGIYPLRYFCSGALPDELLSRQAVAQRLLALVAKEDKSHPLSDPELQRLLSQNGVGISRRAVTKYRTALGVPNRTERKKRER